MKRLFVVALAALCSLSNTVRAEGPDDQYIEIYKLIQEGDGLAASSQIDAAKQRYAEAQMELKKLQASHPNWNEKLVQYRLRTLDAKLGAIPKEAAPLPETPGSSKTAAPSPTPQATQPPGSAAAPQQAPPQAQPDERDNQIKVLQQQVGQLQSDKTVLESKLREALSAQPAAVDPRELARAEERIRVVEKEKEVLKVSLELAEAKAAQPNEAGAAEAKKALDAATQKLAQQNEMITALRQEKDILERRVQETKHSGDEALQTLRTENETLKKQLVEKAPAAEPARSNDQKELTETKAALQSSREVVSSLQGRLRTLEEERDSLEKTRKDLESKLASSSTRPAPSSPADSALVKRLQQERDDLQKKLNDTVRQLAENKNKTKQTRGEEPSQDLTAIRARLAVLDAQRIPYTPEELALFKKPDDLPKVVMQVEEEKPATPEKSAAPDKPAAAPPASIGPLLAEAQRAFSARRFDEAEKKYLEALQLDEKNVSTLQRLAAAQLEQNRPQDADATLKRALDQGPADARSLLLMGIAKFDQEKYDEALDSLSRSAQIDAQNPETQNYLGITLSQKGQRAAAETALRKAIQIDPGYKSAHYNLAVIYATQKPPFLELARWHYQKALAYGHPASADLEKMLEPQPAPSPK